MTRTIQENKKDLKMLQLIVRIAEKLQDLAVVALVLGWFIREGFFDMSKSFANDRLANILREEEFTIDEVKKVDNRKKLDGAYDKVKWDTFKGLRQGDPLSPILFNIVVDIERGESYADDTVVFLDHNLGHARNLFCYGLAKEYEVQYSHLFGKYRLAKWNDGMGIKLMEWHNIPIYFHYLCNVSRIFS
ncbi:hypothetical protein ACJX0J_006149 [Zea mays]